MKRTIARGVFGSREQWQRLARAFKRYAARRPYPAIVAGWDCLEALATGDGSAGWPRTAPAMRLRALADIAARAGISTLREHAIPLYTARERAYRAAWGPR